MCSSQQGPCSCENLKLLLIWQEVELRWRCEGCTYRWCFAHSCYVARFLTRVGVPVLHHPYLVLSRFIKQLDISLIHLRRVGYDLVTEWLSDWVCVSWSDTMPLPWPTFPVAFSRCSMFTFCALDLFSFLLTFKYHHDWEISSNIKGRALEKKVT